MNETLNIYLKHNGNEYVSERNLKYFLPLIYPVIIKEISISKINEYYDNLDFVNANYINKRFDFISIPLRLIIEFDGIQHFEQVSYFHSYDDFVNLQHNDLLKQKFIKENNFNLIRIKDHTKISELYNLLKDVRFDSDEPKAIFIENNDIKICSTSKLKTVDDAKVMVLEQKVKGLEKELLSLYEAQEKIPKKHGVKLINYKHEVVELRFFINWLNNKNLFIGEIASNIMYQEYVYWGTKIQKLDKLLKPRDFTMIMSKLLEDDPTIPLKYCKTQTKLSSISLLNCNLDILNEYYFDNEIKVNKYNNTTYYICDDKISDKDLDQFLDSITNNKLYKITSYKEHLMLEYLISKNNEIAFTYKNNLKK